MWFCGDWNTVVWWRYIRGKNWGTTMSNINIMIFTYFMMFWMKKFKVRKTYLEYGVCIWDLSYCLQVFYNQQEQRNIKCYILLFKGKNKGFGFVFEFWVYKWFTIFSSLFDNSLLPKASHLKVWWRSLFIGEFVVVLGGKTNGI